MNYIPLNVKTHYEILSSLIKIEDLVLYAKKNNVSSLGITDSNMFGSLEFINLCKKNNALLKLIKNVFLFLGLKILKLQFRLKSFA